jgi:hypothetical protein
MQIGDTARAAYDTIVSLMVIVSFHPLYLFIRQCMEDGAHWSAASGMARNADRDPVLGRSPGGITNVWIFEGKLALGTTAFVGSAWVQGLSTVARPLPVHRMSSAPDDKA